MRRPVFSKALSADEFQKFYWYKTELQEICQDYQLPTYGTKHELEGYILQFLNGKPSDLIQPARKRRHRTTILANQMTPQTRILAEGISFNNECRQFFCHYYQVKKFSFTKAMGIKMRAIEANNDREATIQDLIDAYEQGTVDLGENKEEKTYQWNNFLRDFSKDEISLRYQEPLRVAAILWGKVRDSDRPKKYDRQLVKDYSADIASFLKETNNHRRND